MFKSISDGKFLNRDRNSNVITYTISDDDFLIPFEVFFSYGEGERSYRGKGKAVIECYQWKKLNVARNFLKFLEFITKNSYYTFEDELKYQLESQKMFFSHSFMKKFENDLNKYLMLR